MPRGKKAAEQDAKDKLIAELLEKVRRQDEAQGAMLRQLAAATPSRNVTSGQLFVGIRNVSAYTISIESKVTDEPTLDLHAPVEGVHDPNTVGIISYAWWQHLRRGREYGRGMIVRDDSVLGSNYEAAPLDNPKDCHPDHEKHLVLDAKEWIAARTDEEITQDISRMTVEAPLRKLEAIHFKERERLLNEHVALPWPDRKRRVEREMPSKYKHLKAVIVERLKEIEPKSD